MTAVVTSSVDVTAGTATIQAKIDELYDGVNVGTARVGVIKVGTDIRFFKYEVA